MKRKRSEPLTRKVLFRLPDSKYRAFKRLMVDYDTSMQAVLFRFVGTLDSGHGEELMELIGVEMPEDA